MLFPLVKKVDWYNPFKAIYQCGLILIAGTCFYLYGDISLIGFDPVKSVPSIVSSSPSSDLDKKMAELLSKNTLKDHEDLYKIFKGISEYSKNAINIDNTVDVYKAIENVINTYEVKSKFTQIADLVDDKLSSLKSPAKFVEKKKEVEKLFNDLANAVKYSAENRNWEK